MRTDGNGEVERDGRDVLVLVAKHTKVPEFSDSDQICPSRCIKMHPDDSLRFISLLGQPSQQDRGHLRSHQAARWSAYGPWNRRYLSMEFRHLALILSDQPCRCTVRLLGCCSLLLITT